MTALTVDRPFAVSPAVEVGIAGTQFELEDITTRSIQTLPADGALADWQIDRIVDVGYWGHMQPAILFDATHLSQRRLHCRRSRAHRLIPVPKGR